MLTIQADMKLLFNLIDLLLLVPEEFVWFSIQSDAGITIGSLGRLAGNADPSLLGGPLIGIKSLVSTEASSIESRFMEGATEHAKFGVAEIRVKDTAIISSFIVSTVKGHISQQTTDLVRDLSLNLGRALIQYPELTQIAESGMSIPRDKFAMAFLKAVKITRMNFKIEKSSSEIFDLFTEKLNNYTRDPSKLLEQIDGLFDTKGWKIKNDYWNDGQLIPPVKEDAKRRFVLEVVAEIIDEEPMKLINVDHKRDILRKLISTLDEYVSEKIAEPHELILKRLPKEIEKGYGESIAKANLKDLHNVEKLLYTLYVRRALLFHMKKKPLIIFSNLQKSLIWPKFLEWLPPVETINVGQYYTRGLSKFVSPDEFRYVQRFYQEFMAELHGIEVSKPAYDLFSIYASNFVEIEELKKQMLLLEDHSVDGRWKKELQKKVEDVKNQGLKIQSLYEANTVTGAAIQSSIKALIAVIEDYFVKQADEPIGRFAKELVSLYLETGPVVKISSMLSELLNVLENTEYGLKFYMPLPKDFIMVGLLNNTLKLNFEDAVLDVSKDWKVKFDDNEESVFSFVKAHPSYLIEHNGIYYKEAFDIIEPSLLLELLSSSNDFLYEAVLQSGLRKVRGEIIHIADEWANQFAKELNFAASLFSKSSITDMNEFKQLQFGFFSESISTLDRIPHPLRSNFVEVKKSMEEIANGFQIVWENIENEVYDGKYSNQTRKTFDDIKKTTQKSLKQLQKELSKIQKSVEKEVEAAIKPFKKKIQKVLKESAESILNFLPNKFGELLPEKAIVSKVEQTISSNDVLTHEGLRTVRVGVSLNIFSSAPHIILESAYNEIITNKKSKFVKAAMKMANSRKEFESLMKEQSDQIVSTFFEEMRDMIELIEEAYIDQDAPVFIENQAIFLQLGKISVEDIVDADLLSGALNFPGIHLERESTNWLIKYQLPYFSKDKPIEFDLITLSNAMRFIARERFLQDTKRVLAGIQAVISTLELEAGMKLEEFLGRIDEIMLNI